MESGKIGKKETQETHKTSPHISWVERGIALALGIVVLLTLIVLVLNPRSMDGGTLAIVRFLAATFAGISGYLFSGNIGLEARIPLNKTQIRATGAFAAFIIVLFLFFVGVPDSSGNARNSNSTESQNSQWLYQLKHNSIIPGVGLAGVKIGDTESEAIEILGKPVRFRHVEGEGKEIFVDDRKGFVLHYALLYETDNIFLGIYTNRDTREVKRFRLHDASFNSNKFLPSVQGITIGSSVDQLVEAMGQPIRIKEHSTCPDFGDPKVTSKARSYVYEGITFWICEANQLVYNMDIQID